MYRISSGMSRLLLTLPVISGIMWGAGGVFVRAFSALGMDNFTMLFTRVLVAVILLAAGLFFYDRSLLKLHFRDLWIFLGGGVPGMFCINLTYNEAVRHGTLALASVLLSMSPLFVVLFSAVLFHEALTVRKVCCMGAALGGCILVSGVLEQSPGHPVSVWAVVCGAAAAFFYALYSIFSKAGAKKGYHPFTITFYCLVFSLLALTPGTDFSCIVRVLKEGGPVMPWFMLLHSLVTSALPYICYTAAISRIDAGTVSILAASEPAAAMLFGFLFFQEQPTLLSLLGLVITTLAIAALGRSQTESD